MKVDHSRPVEILLVEDNEGDVFLTKKAFEKAKIVNNIHVAKDGEMAMEMLMQARGHEGMPRPDIVLLDINLPKKGGLQVLEEIKSNESLRRIPVVMVSSSQAEQEVIKTYDLHASAYIIKPIDAAKFQDVVAAVENFWFKIVVLSPE
jgi:CheY-like chemotaxis protein